MQVLVELLYWPPVSWMTLAIHSEMVWLEVHEHFQKGSYRNRCHIAGPNGPQRLSIPLQKGKHQQSPIRDVRIARENGWQRIHWRSIQTAYGNAPYYEHYADIVEALYRKPQTFLFDFNLAILDCIVSCLDQNISTSLTTSFQPFHYQARRTDSHVLDLRNALHPGGEKKPVWFKPAPYPQVFMEKYGFLPDLSLLDLLFCCGKHAVEILNKSMVSEFPQTSVD